MRQKIAPWFDRVIKEQVSDSLHIMEERGGQYGDSWGPDMHTTHTDEALRHVFGIDLRKVTHSQKRALLLSAIVDIKTNRKAGAAEYLEDTDTDLVNYLMARKAAMLEAIRRR